jgi:hypothetical protein
MNRLMFHTTFFAALVMLLLFWPTHQTVHSDDMVAAPFADYYWRYHGQRVLGAVNSQLIEVDGYQVQYFEKGRLENHAHETDDPLKAIVHSPLTVEMMQTAPDIQIDGLPVTYGDLAAYATRIPPPDGFEQGTSTVTPQGTFVPDDPELNVVDGYLVAPYFWTYMNQQYLFPAGWMHTFGLPLTQPFEVSVELNGQPHTLTLQAFERAVLLFNPARTHGGNVARANIGTDALWVYGGVPLFQYPETSPAEMQVPTGPRRIEISLAHQWLYAYEGERLVMDVPVSTGKEHFETPTGQFRIYSRVRQKRLQGSAHGETWNIPDVPFILFFHGSYAIHGVYWHNSFGTGERLSHGCIGLIPADAAALYEWAPRGTPVIIY